MSFMSSLRGYPSHTHELPLLLSTTFSIDFFFFFQAEDGIRDGRVTGVQTCALPISGDLAEHAGEAADGVAVLRQIGSLEQVLADLRPRRARHLFDPDDEDNPGRAGRDRAHALMDGDRKSVV